MSKIRIGYGSDFHLEFEQNGSNPAAYAPGEHPTVGPDFSGLREQLDLVILAGDIDVGRAAHHYAVAVADYLNRPVVSIAGNHEYWRQHLHRHTEDRRGLSSEHELVHYLENERVDFDVRGQKLAVLGATLWTDYTLSRDIGWLMRAQNDFKRIKVSGDRLRPKDLIELHRASLSWLAEAIAAAREEANIVIVVTHHSPIPVYRPEWIYEATGAFCSDLRAQIGEWQPDVWIYGHLHGPGNDEYIGRTRLLSKPRGYLGYEPGVEAYELGVIEL